MGVLIYMIAEWLRVFFFCLTWGNDLNKVVMNYLVIEGYKDAAEAFAQESGTERM